MTTVYETLLQDLGALVDYQPRDDEDSVEVQVWRLVKKWNEGILRESQMVARWQPPQQAIPYGVFKNVPGIWVESPLSVSFVARWNDNIRGRVSGRGFALEAGRVVLYTELDECMVMHPAERMDLKIIVQLIDEWLQVPQRRIS